MARAPYTTEICLRVRRRLHALACRWAHARMRGGQAGAHLGGAAVGRRWGWSGRRQGLTHTRLVGARGRRAARPAGPAGAPLDTLPTQPCPPPEAPAARTRRWADLSEPAKDLLLKMLDYDPAKRITSKQARAPHSPTVSLTLPYL